MSLINPSIGISITRDEGDIIENMKKEIRADLFMNMEEQREVLLFCIVVKLPNEKEPVLFNILIKPLYDFATLMQTSSWIATC